MLSLPFFSLIAYSVTCVYWYPLSVTQYYSFNSIVGVCVPVIQNYLKILDIIKDKDQYRNFNLVCVQYMQCALEQLKHVYITYQVNNSKMNENLYCTIIQVHGFETSKVKLLQFISIVITNFNLQWIATLWKFIAYCLVSIHLQLD